MMWRVLKIGLPLLALAGVLGLMVVMSGGATHQVLDPYGVVGSQQRDLLFLATGLMLIVTLPVIILVIVFALRYHEGAKGRRFTPDWAHNNGLEVVWWGVPLIIVGVLSLVVWNTSHSLDPYRPLVSNQAPLKIQVVALQWRWLFIYPEQNLASVGEFAFPTNRPVEFTITSDAPMNSFWIPQLGGQIYAMSGMSTTLHLDATKTGDYRGVSANISGKGHANMTFTAKVRSNDEYQSWLKHVSSSDKTLDTQSYEALRHPSTSRDVAHYKLGSHDLYQTIVDRYSHSHMSGSSY